MPRLYLLPFTFPVILLLNGCSGHTLQDWADETFNDKPQAVEKNKPANDIPKMKHEQNSDVKPLEPLTEKPEPIMVPESEVTTTHIETPLETPATVSKTPSQPSPSQNSQLNAVSPSPTATAEGGAMQKSLDTWTKEEWTPAVEQNKTIKAMNEEKERPFTLQEYVDKAGVYIDNKPKSDKPAHYEEMEKLPVIGK